MNSNLNLSKITTNSSTIFFAIGVLLIITFSWLGVLDIASAEYIDGAILQAGITFAVLRAANAAVTVLRESQITVGIGLEGNIAIGGVLDPVHDLIEQASSLMKYAIASLLIQKLMLTITSNLLFKILLTIIGSIALFLSVLRKERYFITVVKSFIFVVFLRFALVLVVILNGFVDDIYINDKLDQDLQKLEKTTLEAEEIEKSLERSSIGEQAQSQDTDEDKTWWGSIKEKTGNAIQGTKDRMKGMNPSEKISLLQERFNNMIDDILNAMALFTLKTLILPLLFLYLIILGTKAIWNVDLREFRSYSKTNLVPSDSKQLNFEKNESPQNT